MSKNLFIKAVAPVVFLSLGLFTGCVKTYRCKNCGNKSPIAIAGNDTIIKLPANRVILNGSKSYDPDGTIVAYRWSRRTGRAGFHITQENSVETEVTGLTEGEYLFQLEVKDNNLQPATNLVAVYVIR